MFLLELYTEFERFRGGYDAEYGTFRRCGRLSLSILVEMVER